MVRTKRPNDTWDVLPNKQLIEALDAGYYVVMANPIGNELEYILEKSFSESESEGKLCPNYESSEEV